MFWLKLLSGIGTKLLWRPFNTRSDQVFEDKLSGLSSMSFFSMPDYTDCLALPVLMHRIYPAHPFLLQHASESWSASLHICCRRHKSHIRHAVHIA